MLKRVGIKKKIQSKDFLKFLSVKDKKQLLQVAARLRGKKIIHVNATASGGGVAEILMSLIPYVRSLGIHIEWYVIDPQRAGEKFFSFTNRLHNALQGASVPFTEHEWNTYKEVNKKIADNIKEMDYDILIINDPQPLLVINHLRDHKPKIYFNHIDTTTPYQKVWKRILPVIKRYDHVIFSNSNFISLSDQFRNILIYAMIGDTCHRNWILSILILASKNEI